MSSGVFVVDKPAGLTSHDVIARVRRALGTRRAGHAGTLDPMATGVLVVMVGEATKLQPWLTADDKGYRASVKLGIATDTLDAEGAVTAACELPPWCHDEAEAAARIERALDLERARSSQTPPAHSAIKVAGVASYRRARAGEAAELAPRPVAVRRLALVGRSPDRLDLELDVAKGYYVRALARDLGAALGLPAHLVGLCRTRSGAFTLADAVALERVATTPLLELAVAAGRCLPVAQLTAEGAERARRGATLAAEHFAGALGAGDTAWVDGSSRLVAVGRAERGIGTVIRVFSNV
jgi:tRNA pseudouridine55 synthase